MNTEQPSDNSPPNQINPLILKESRRPHKHIELYTVICVDSNERIDNNLQSYEYVTKYNVEYEVATTLEEAMRKANVFWTTDIANEVCDILNNREEIPNTGWKVIPVQRTVKSIVGF